MGRPVDSRFRVTTGSRTQSELRWPALTGSGRGVVDGAFPGPGGAPDASSTPPQPGLVRRRRGCYRWATRRGAVMDRRVQVERETK